MPCQCLTVPSRLAIPVPRSGLRAPLRPHLGLALLWASQANTVASTFWALGMLLLPENE